MLPLYQNIINTIQDQIQSGAYQPNDKLPSETQLMKDFSTSRITVTRALKELELKGIIYRQKGKGSFVSPVRKPGSSRIISLILPHKSDFFSGGQQYSRPISRRCQEKGYLCSIHYSDQSTRKERQILEEIENHQVAGAIIYPISNKNISTLSRMSIKGLPMVLLDRKLEELSLPVITSDNFNGSFNAVSYLAKKGHQKIAFVGSKDSDVVSQRYKGYCHALLQAQIPLNRDIIITHFEKENEDEQSVLKEDEAIRILENLRASHVTAVFCVNDLIAYRFLNAAHGLGMKIPQDLSLVGFDNMKYMSDQSPVLTTVAQNFTSIAEHCVDLLLKMIESEQAVQIEDSIIPTAFLEGETVSPS